MIATDATRMENGHHLGEMNAPWACGVCNELATAYLHGTGFRCGECETSAPDERRPTEVPA